MATANTSNIQLVHRHFSSEKCVDPLNQTLPTFSMSMHFFTEFVNKATGLRLQRFESGLGFGLGGYGLNYITVGDNKQYHAALKVLR